MAPETFEGLRSLLGDGILPAQRDDAAASACASATLARLAAGVSPRSASTSVNWRICAAVRPVRMLAAMCERSCGSAPGVAASGSDRGEFSTLPIEVVALENVTEQMGLQELVDGRSKVRHCVLDRRAGNLGLVGRADGEQLIARWNGSAGLASRRRPRYRAACAPPPPSANSPSAFRLRGKPT